jgi:hypothetical protein
MLLSPHTWLSMSAGVRTPSYLQQHHPQQQWQHALHHSTSLCSSSQQQASTADSDDKEDTLADADASADAASSSSSSSSPIAKLQPEKPLRVERLLANLGYGKRQECAMMLKRRRVVYADTGKPAKVGDGSWCLLQQLKFDHVAAALSQCCHSRM